MLSDPKWPQRPHPDILSEAIPLFFIGRNKDGFWVALNSDGSAGGIFLLKRSALWFTHRKTQPWGCATWSYPKLLNSTSRTKAIHCSRALALQAGTPMASEHALDFVKNDKVLRKRYPPRSLRPIAAPTCAPI
jgi:hypothetical protein